MCCLLCSEVFLFFVGMGVVVVSRPVFGLWGWLVFWFLLFFGLCWAGWAGFCSRAVCWLYVGWDGTRMGGHVGVDACGVGQFLGLRVLSRGFISS
jgi:hypothetical protein